jgi:hypothetical protein
MQPKTTNEALFELIGQAVTTFVVTSGVAASNAFVNYMVSVAGVKVD